MLSLLGSLRRGNFVTNSLRFRSNASAFLSRTFTTPTSSTVFTWSGWVKRGALGVTARLLGASTTTNFGFNSSDQLLLTLNGTAAVTTTAVYRDPSAWYHIVYAQNGAAQTIYVNGSSAGTGATANTVFNTAIAHQLGAANTTNYFDGYLTEVNFIDGQALTPASFGQIESTTGVWSPKQYVGTYGTNGFYLKFSDASAATAAAIGKDSSGNGNNWTPSGISVTAGVTYDSMLDVPVNYSDSGNGRGNYCVLNAASIGADATVSNANLSIAYGGSADRYCTMGTIGMTSGKWYAEFLPTAGSTPSPTFGISSKASSTEMPSYVGINGFGWGYYFNGTKYHNGINTAYGAAWTTNDVIGVALDIDTGELTFYKNGITQGVAFTGLTSGPYFFAVGDGSATGTYSASVNFGQRPFTYTPPAGFRALNTNNLPTPSIVNGANFMAATTYTGNATARSLSNAVNSVSFQPDLVWIKSRTPDTSDHALFDSVRGTSKYLSSNTTAAETTNANTLTAFNGDGFSLGTDTTIVNANSASYIAWQWKEGVTVGLDVVSYAGTGLARTVAHNLGATPRMIIIKRSGAGATSNWQVRHTQIAITNRIQFNQSTEAVIDASPSVWNGISPNAAEFSIGTSADVNTSGANYIAYCFAEIAGFSKFSSYTGNGLANGPFVFCGFKPKWVMYKSISGGVNSNWQIFDSTRDAYNVVDEAAAANVTSVVSLGAYIDLLSNGFKLRTTSNAHNGSGVAFVFAAFAEVPSKYALAR